MSVRKRRHDLGVKFHRPCLAGHMRRVQLTNQPLVGRIDPNVQALIEDELYGFLGYHRIERSALYLREVGIDKYAAGKACDGRPQSERLDKHCYPTGPP